MSVFTPESRHRSATAADAMSIVCLRWSEADRQASSGGEVDTIFGFENEHDALERIREKSQAWLIDHK
jgi:hypothetical protein